MSKDGTIHYDATSCGLLSGQVANTLVSLKTRKLHSYF